MTGNDNFGPEDVTPGVYLNDFDSDVLLSEFGHDPESPLALLVKAIIAAHPHPKKDDEKRFRSALSALTGKSLTKRRADDYDALMRMAWLYHCEKTSDPKCKPDRNALANSVITPEYWESRSAKKESIIKKLSRDFKKQKRLLLARITSQDDWDRMDKIRTLKKVSDVLCQLGIPSDKSAIKPRIVQRDFSEDS